MILKRFLSSVLGWESTIKRSGHPTSGVMLSLSLLIVFPAFPPPRHPPENAYLDNQVRALQLPFQHHLDVMADSPFYQIDALVDLEKATVEGQLRLDYTNTTGRSLAELVFRLLPNATSIYGGGSLVVETVTEGARRLYFELSADGTVLRVPLSRRLAPGRSVALDMQFVTQIPTNNGQGYGILKQTPRITSLAGWYPILAVYQDGWQTPDIPKVGDAMVAETSLYDVALDVPREVDVVSTGMVARLERTGSRTVWHMISGPARDFAVAIGADFETREARVGGVAVRFHTLPTTSARTSSDAAFSTIIDAFKVFGARFGPYPFTEFDVVEAPISIGGYEFSGMVYVDDGLRVHGAPSDYRFIVAHEVAHQWWYGLVGNDSILEPWLDESLASYAAAIYLEHAEGQARADGLVAYWRGVYGLREGHDPPINSAALEFSSWLTYRSPVYYQGALFLDTLRAEMGDSAFFLLLRRYMASNRYQSVTTEDFLQMAESVVCRDLHSLFKDWFEVDSGGPPRQCALRSRGQTTAAVFH